MQKQPLPLLLAVAALAGASLACNVGFGGARVETGPTETLTIDQAVPADAEVIDLSVNMGAGELSLSGGADGALEGEIKDNVVEWTPSVTADGDSIAVDQGNGNGNGDGVGLFGPDVVNDWTLHLGDTVPYDLQVNAGAYAGTLDLSGIPLHSVDINDGASQADVVFTSLNPVTMTTFTYSTGASAVTLTGLGYANADTIAFNGGAGNYTLDLTGDWQREVHVNIAAGLANVEIEVPASAPVIVVVDGSLNDVDTTGSWDIEGTQYMTTGSTGPTISVYVEMSVGSLKLTAK